MEGLFIYAYFRLICNYFFVLRSTTMHPLNTHGNWERQFYKMAFQSAALSF